MPGGILKKEWAQQGQKVRVEARPAIEQPLVPPAQAPAHQATPEPQRPAPQELARREAISAAEQIRSEAEQMAAEIADQAAQEATEIKERTTEEINRMRAEAEEELAARRAMLEQQVRGELTKEYQDRYIKSLQALEGAAAEIQRNQAQYLSAMEGPAFELVLGIARQVLGRELGDAARSLPALIAQAFNMIKPRDPLMVRVSPATFQQLTESELFAETLSRAGVRLERIELEIDSALNDGQFRAESAGSYIECDLPALLEEMVAHLQAQARLETEPEEGGA